MTESRVPLSALEQTPSLLDRPLAGGRGTELPPPGEGRDEGGPGLFADSARFGLIAFLGTVSMMFIGFTSAYLIRRTAADWRPLSPPDVLWWNTAALLLSSAFLQLSRRRLAVWDLSLGRRWLSAAGAFGLLFLAGQIAAWRILSGEGVTLASNPHSSFLYLLAGVHAAHLLGGLFWFAVLRVRLGRQQTTAPDPLRLFAVYWHFLGVLWIYLLFLVFVM
jgi:cytochrome c oxidase subunit 3